MSNSLLTIIRENIPEIKGPARAVLMALADRANDAGVCWPSIATIAKDAGVCRSTAKTALRKLRSAGYVTSTPSVTVDGDAGCNTYHVTVGGRAGDAPPRAADARRVGQEMPDGRAGDAPKASTEASTETLFPMPEESHNLEKLLPKGWKRMNQTDRNLHRVGESSPVMLKIGECLGRKPSTKWSVAETVALINLNPPPDEVALIHRFYTEIEADPEQDWRRTKIATLLNNWTGELDKARVHFSKKSRSE